MHNKLNARHGVSHSLTKARCLEAIFEGKGTVKMNQYRNGELIAVHDFHNSITDAGINALLGIMFHGVTQITTWYLGLIDNAGFSALADGDTMASHGGWTEFVDYDEANRVEWPEDAAATRAITNTTPMTFTASDDGTLKAVFLVGGTGASTKSASTGTLWAHAAFASPVVIQTDDVLELTYAVSG